jgi:glucose uptake protein
MQRIAPIGLAISVSAVTQLLLINVIAFFAFDERLTASQMAGIGLGLISMILPLFPIGAKGNSLPRRPSPARRSLWPSSCKVAH